ncbi:MAG: D-alanyl-D-alanine carboxypeptidase [Candidatus Buchananbacteria bacterium]|nr:D-alanyl-D-alanine carboxypeptidase [Candidatus Buchananbacteria bacterium]
MINLIASIVLTSLLFPAGFDFFTSHAIDYSYVSNHSAVLDAPVRLANNSFGLKTTAKSILVIDSKSGAALYDKNSAAITPIASITKLLTALVVVDHQPDWNKVVEVKTKDQREGGQVYLLPGEQVTTKDLFAIMLVGSANEAALALADSLELTDFAAAMNSKAAELGMINSYFVEPSGIDPRNTSTAADLLKLANAAFNNPTITEALTAQRYEFTVINNNRPSAAKSTNQLLSSFLNRDSFDIVGAKTGYLDEAGYCLVMKIKTADSVELLVALLGAQTIDDRWQEAKGLVDWVLNNYQWPLNQS